MILTDPSPEVLARHERKLAERLARRVLRMVERFERKLGIEPKCDICGATTHRARSERCRGVCE